MRRYEKMKAINLFGKTLGLQYTFRYARTTCSLIEFLDCLYCTKEQKILRNRERSTISSELVLRETYFHGHTHGMNS